MLFVHEIITHCDLNLGMSRTAFCVMSLEKVRLRCLKKKKTKKLFDLILIFV